MWCISLYGVLDLDIFVEMVKLARKMAQSPALKDLIGLYFLVFSLLSWAKFSF
jgi:hypothetical protein